jgi:very-short-patch-repair endonuclease
MGRYSVDFLLRDQRIALEVDGAYWHRNLDRDARKTAWLRRHAWRVVRISEASVRGLGARRAVSLALLESEQTTLTHQIGSVTA